MKNFKGYQVDECGVIINTLKPNLNCEHINCTSTTGHRANIVTKRTNDVEVTYYKDKDRWGAEVYFFKKGTHEIKYSRNYQFLKGLPRKYEEIVSQLIFRHSQLFE